LLPDVPTLAECGYPDHALEIWFGVFGANLSRDPAAAIDAARSSTALRAALQRVGLSGGITDAAALAREIDASRAAWQRALASAQ
jgi:tripartite-type tricarboxylate transporter receptor subunit TctC